jgi:hypothetical protein
MRDFMDAPLKHRRQTPTLGDVEWPCAAAWRREDAADVREL